MFSPTFGLPALVEAHGSRWIAILALNSDDNASYYLAVPAADRRPGTPDDVAATSCPLPVNVSMIAVPFPPEEAAKRRERRLAREAKEAAPVRTRQTPPDHAYLSAGDNPYASGDRANHGCSLCGRPRSDHSK